MTEEDAFQAAIDAAPLDQLPRLVFCDWLDEQGDPRAEGYRVLAEYDRWPWVATNGNFRWFLDSVGSDKIARELKGRNHGIDRSGLGRWSRGIRDEEYRSRCAAMEAAALDWENLSADDRQACLEQFARLLG